MMKLPIINAKPTMDAETYYNFTFNHTDVKKAKVCLSHHNAKIKIENLFSLRKNIPWIGYLTHRLALNLKNPWFP